MKRLTQEKIDRVNELIGEGWSDRAIKSEVGASRHTISAIRSGDITRPPPRKRRRTLNYAERMKVRARIATGELLRDIAADYKVTTSTISKIKTGANCASDLEAVAS